MDHPIYSDPNPSGKKLLVYHAIVDHQILKLTKVTVFPAYPLSQLPIHFQIYIHVLMILYLINILRSHIIPLKFEIKIALFFLFKGVLSLLHIFYVRFICNGFREKTG